MRIEKLLKKLRVRNDEGKSAEFIEAFDLFVKAYLRYKYWIDKYDCRDQAKDDIDLIESIKKHGLKEDIVVGKDEFGTEVDGYHRIIILKNLGHEEVTTSDGSP